MSIPVINTIQVIEMGDLLSWLASAKGISYSEMENMMPGMFYEGEYYLSVDNADEDNDWYKEFADYLAENNIDMVKLIHDD